MKPEKKARLIEHYDQIAAWRRAGVEDKEIAQRMCDLWGATLRYIGGTDILRCDGIAGQSTSGIKLVIDSWTRAMTMALAKADMDQRARQ